ncbi:MAG: DNA polymerase I [Bdellovibrionales bacterium]|nr:DNA polymerase I [Bdellovibrionales bacterium]
MKKLYLVDVSSMFFRAFFAVPRLSTKSGLPTNALVGFLNMTVKLLKEEKPDFMVYCMDRKEPSFRKDLFTDYKANRTEMPEDLVPQLPYISKITESLGIPHLDKLGFEADDVIGSLTRMGREAGLEVVIVSGDKDFAQLVGPHVSILDTMKNVIYDSQGVVEKWGIHPEQMIDYLALVGDSSDNIPGVKGVGPKGAQKLLAEFKTLDGIYENIEKISGKSLKSKLETDRKNAYLAKKLVTIVQDIDFEVGLDALQLQPVHQPQLEELLVELEFERFLKKLTGNGVSEKRVSTSDSHDGPKVTKDIVDAVEVGTTITSWPEERWSLSQLEERVSEEDEITGLLNSRGFCIGWNNKAIVVDADRSEIGRVLGDKSLNWRGFDLKNIWHSLQLERPGHPVWDSMVAAYIIRAGNIEDSSKVTSEYLHREVPELASPGMLLALDANLQKSLQKNLQRVKGEKIFKELELPLIPVLFKMENRGILLDQEDLHQQSEQLAKDIESLEESIQEKAGESFNVASTKQLATILFDKLGLPVGKKTKTGYSTSSDVLVKLQDEYPICREILEFRELSKLKSTYVDALPKLVDANGVIHTQLRQCSTATGRLSSVNPNLQNIPIRTERGRYVRRAFVARPGQSLLSVDYSQIELRVLADITQDPGLLNAFENDLDIHSATASEIFDVPIEEMTSELRRKAKAVNFGIAYGQGAFGLSEALGIGRGEASEIIDRYFKRFKKVEQYMHETIERAKKDGFVETKLGRRRYIDELKSSNGNIRKFGERAAINAPIQGAASDIVKKAMIDVDQSISQPMLLQVHDELLIECPKDEVEPVAQEVKAVMEGAVNMSVPLKVNIAWGDNWEEAH